MSDEKDPAVQDLLKQLMDSQGDGDSFMAIGPDGQPMSPEMIEVGADSPIEEPELLKQGQRVSISGPASSEENAPEITVYGEIYGLAPIMTPFGPMGFDYIILLDDPSQLPTPEGKDPYPYRCLTASPDAVKSLDDDTPAAE